MWHACDVTCIIIMIVMHVHVLCIVIGSRKSSKAKCCCEEKESDNIEKPAQWQQKMAVPVRRFIRISSTSTIMM